ncbi:CgeB family protein [Phenylobacterium sp.]|uniref:CgeB family protein n=1 Tax=Phenylobacterium sp. TaxID=1871053 RepID=UPI002FE1429D
MPAARAPEAQTGATRSPRVLVVTAGTSGKKSFLADAFRERYGADVLAGKRWNERRIDRVLQPFGLGRIVANARALNRDLLERAGGGYDLICVIKGLSVRRETLEALRSANPHAKLVCWTCDDQFLPHNQTPAFLRAAPAYDMIFTCKSHNVRNRELEGLGFQRVEFLYQAFSEADHHPRPNGASRHRGRVVFIGFAERKRFDYMNFLAANGVEVDVYGTGWDRGPYRAEAHPNLKLHMKPLLGDEYADALSNAAISLCFLRELNRDLHTSRTFEIPACGGFMLAERTGEHAELFREGEEAEFFETKEELLDKVRAYLAAPEQRAQVAKRGYERTRNSDYSYRAMVERIVQQAFASQEGPTP